MPSPPDVRPQPIRVRPARADDLERLVEIHASAFPDRRRREERVRQLTLHPLAGAGDLWVGVDDGGALVGHALLFPLEAWFGGRRVRVGGIASVGVAPEARRRGVASALLAHLHEVARDRGDALTFLYPFRQRFYAEHGYAPAVAGRRLRLSPQAIPWA
ncbi:MAG: GNAT family N-acetyltransferase, partial [Myxococcales bacterium]|nr:GNAT family N-acetyltransferase [Myxococcales bacterium]